MIIGNGISWQGLTDQIACQRVVLLPFTFLCEKYKLDRAWLSVEIICCENYICKNDRIYRSKSILKFRIFLILCCTEPKNSRFPKSDNNAKYAIFMQIILKCWDQ